MPLSLSGTTGIVTGNIADSNVTAGKLASGAARANFGAGAVLQVVSTTKTDVFGTNSLSFVDVPGLSVSITPSSVSSKILVMASGCGGMDSANSGALRLLRDSTSISVGSIAAGYTSVSFANFYGGSGDGNNSESFSITFLDLPSSTSPLTYKIQVIVSGGTVRINSNGSDLSGQPYSFRSASSITVMEISG